MPLLKRPSAAIPKTAAKATSIASQLDVVDLPVLTEEHVKVAARIKCSSDAQLWFLDGYFMAAFGKYSQALSTGVVVPVKEGIRDLFSKLFRSKTGKVVNKQQLSETRKNANFGKLGKEVKAMGSIATHSDRLFRRVLETTVANSFPTEKLTEYIDHCSQDETSAEVTKDISHAWVVQSESQNSESLVPAQNSLVASYFNSAPKQMVSCKLRVPAKIVQSMSEFWMQVCLDEDEGRFLVFHGQIPNCPQMVDRNTAEAYLEAELMRSSRTEQIQRFKCKSRDSCHDSHASNAKMERAVLDILNKGANNAWQSTRRRCQPHFTYGAMKKSFKTMEPMVSCQINWAMSINNSLADWQKIIVLKVRELLRVRFGKPPEEYMKFKKKAIALCLQGSSFATLRCLYAFALPNGNWDDHEHCDIWLPPGTVVNIEQLALLVGCAIVNVFAPSLIPVYKRHKFKGIAQAIGALVGFESCHGLFSHCWRDFAAAIHAKPNESVSSRSTSHAVGRLLSGQSNLAASPSMPNSSSSDHAATTDLALSHQRHSRGSTGNTENNCESRVDRGNVTRDDVSKAVNKVSTYLLEHDHGWHYDGLIFKAIIDCKMKFMDAQIARSTIKYTMQQRMKIARGLFQGALDQDTTLKMYAVESAMCVLENQLFEDLETLRDSDAVWVDLIAPQFRTRARGARAHRLISSCECWVESMHVNDHKKHPTRQYLALVSNDLAREVMDDADCITFPWFQDLRKSMKEHALGLRHPFAQGRLRFKAMSEKRDILRLENDHAAFRRRCKKRGVQCKGEEFAELASEFHIPRLISRSNDRRLAPMGMEDQRMMTRDDFGEVKSKRASNTWNLYVRRQTYRAVANGKVPPDTSKLSEPYNNLTEAELEDLRRDCEAADTAKSAPGHQGGSFGMRSRDAERCSERQRALEGESGLVQTLALVDSELESKTACHRASVQHALSNPSSTTLATLLQSARKCERALSLHRQRQDKQNEEILSKWQASAGVERLEQAIHLLPQLEPFKRMMLAVPCIDNRIEFIGDVRMMEDMANLIAQEAISSSRSHARDALAADMDVKCDRIDSANCPVIQDKPKTGKKPPCRDEGICICNKSVTGVYVWSSRQSYLRVMKRVIDTPEKREDIDERRIFIKLCSNDPSWTTDPIQLELLELQGLRQPRESTTSYFCLGAVSWNPYRVCFKEYRESAIRREAVHDDEIHLEATR